MKKQLGRKVQCAKCPWKKSTNPHEIPNGYSVKRHCDLKKTIATPGSLELNNNVMACHHSKPGKEIHCIGYLMNQLGPGNNIFLRLRMLDYDFKGVKTVGPQHECFEDTLPKEAG